MTATAENTRSLIAPTQCGPWKASRYLLVVLACVLLGGGITVAVHVSLDIFGLFRASRGRAIKVYHNERISKYLLSYRYIPENFNTVVLGTSLSDNLDVTPYNTDTSGYRIYNASMMGANITEISAIAHQLTRGGIRTVIFCISPYQLKNTGSKEVMLNEKLYWGALGSKNLYETYVVALAQQAKVGSFPQINAYGVNFFTSRYRVRDVRKQIEWVASAQRNKPIQIDSAAVAEFSALIAHFRKHNVRLIGYFHPIPKTLHDSKAAEHAAFQSMVREIFDDDGSLIDFNSSTYREFTANDMHYIDNGHLSETGQAFVMKALFEKLAAGSPTVGTN